MKRGVTKLTEWDALREAVGLPFGREGGYYVAGVGCEGASVLDYNEPPEGQPGLWCQWVPDQTGEHIEWDGNEKFYGYVPWLRYLIEHFLAPWGYMLNGEVTWFGEQRDDLGMIRVTDNVVEVLIGKIVYERRQGRSAERRSRSQWRACATCGAC